MAPTSMNEAIAGIQHKKIIEFLKHNCNRETAFFRASQQSDERIVDLLAFRGANVHQPKTDGFVCVREDVCLVSKKKEKLSIFFFFFCSWTALMMSTKSDSVAVVETLVVFGFYIFLYPQKNHFRFYLLIK